MTVHSQPDPEELSAIREHKFSKVSLDGRSVQYQVLELGQQLYIYASTTSEMDNLALAVPPAGSHALPAATQLLEGGRTDAAEALARRLAQRCKLPVLVSWNVEGDEMFGIWAEKQLINELKVLKVLDSS